MQTYKQAWIPDDTSGSLVSVPNSTATESPYYYIRGVFVAASNPSPELYSPKDPKKELQRIRSLEDRERKAKQMRSKRFIPNF